MVRHLLLTALLATLAVALPAAAEEDASFRLPSGSDPAGCLLSDLSCGTDGPAAACDAWSDGCPIDDGQDSLDGRTYYPTGTECRPWDLNMPDDNQSLAETLLLDPDGCIQSFLRRTLGWPPTEVIEPYDLPDLPVIKAVLLP